MSYSSSGVINVVDAPDPKWEAIKTLTVDQLAAGGLGGRRRGCESSRAPSRRNGQVINQDKYDTHYLPWGAVCQYNPDKYTPSADNAPCPP